MKLTLPAWSKRYIKFGDGSQTWSEFMGHPPVAAGIAVTEESAEGQPAVFACTRLIANAVAGLPFKLYGRDRVEATDHPLADVLHRLANPEQSAFDFRVLMTTWLLGWGNAYAEVQRNARGEVVALWPLAPWAMRVYRDDLRRLRFCYSAQSGQREWLYDPARPPILRLMIHSRDGLVGRSPVAVLRETVGAALAQEQFGATYFKNGAALSGVLTTVNDLDEDQKKDLSEAIKQVHQGAGKAHKILVVPGGQKYTPMNATPVDAALLEAQGFSRTAICGCYGVPPALIGDMTNTGNFRTFEEQRLAFLAGGVEPTLAQWEAAIARDCLGPREFSMFDARFSRMAFTRTDVKTTVDALATQIDKGIISADEARQLLELPPRAA